MNTQALAAWLYDNLPGQYVRPMGDKIAGWTPEPGRCHENVARWLEDHPDHTAVRGWLNVSFLAPANRRRFGSHSIVAGSTGELLDITLSASDGRYGFIRHPGSEAEFISEVIEKRLAMIDHVLGPDIDFPSPLPPVSEWPPSAI
jgi:hypothetical protein